MRQATVFDHAFGSGSGLGNGSLNDQRISPQGRPRGGLWVQKIELSLVVMESAVGVHPSCRSLSARRQKLNLKMKTMLHIVRVVEPFCPKDKRHPADCRALPSTRPDRVVGQCRSGACKSASFHEINKAERSAIDLESRIFRTWSLRASFAVGEQRSVGITVKYGKCMYFNRLRLGITLVFKTSFKKETNFVQQSRRNMRKKEKT